jgi:hypothetical protein
MPWVVPFRKCWGSDYDTGFADGQSSFGNDDQIGAASRHAHFPFPQNRHSMGSM